MILGGLKQFFFLAWDHDEIQYNMWDIIIAWKYDFAAANDKELLMNWKLAMLNFRTRHTPLTYFFF